MANLDGLRRQLDDKIQRCAAVVAREVEAELKQTAPIDSGVLRAMIHAQVQRTVSGARVKFDSGAPYAEYVGEHREAWDRIMADLPRRVARVWRGIR